MTVKSLHLDEQETQYQNEILAKQQTVEEASGQFERLQQEFLAQNSSYQLIQSKVQEMEISQETNQRQTIGLRGPGSNLAQSNGATQTSWSSIGESTQATWVRRFKILFWPEHAC